VLARLSRREGLLAMHPVGRGNANKVHIVTGQQRFQRRLQRNGIFFRKRPCAASDGHGLQLEAIYMVANRPGVSLAHETRPQDGGPEGTCWRFWHFEFLYSYNKSFGAVGKTAKRMVTY
jgi:hypothetical protein